MATFENCEIFSTYHLSYVQGYKVALRGGNYDHFELDKLSDDECLAEFRFLRNDVYQLAEALGLPEEMKCYNGVRVDGMEALCMYLKRFAYPC